MIHPLKSETSYHIFNHANGFENIFREPENFRYFLEKYQLYISPIAETYAYCLMPNHFHLVVRIRKREVIEGLILKSNYTFPKVSNFGKDKIINRDCDIERYISKQFANLFSCYTQSFNKVNFRRGSLFIKNFKREPITSKEQFLNTVIYTHRNPIHHGFRERFEDWSYCSYFGIISNDEHVVEIDKLLKMFGGRDQFIQKHIDSLKLITDLEIP
jgi:putative transposase